MNIHDRIEARCNNMTEDTPGIIPYCDAADIVIGREERNGQLFFYKQGGVARHCYNVRRYPTHREKMIYTLSQMLQSQQKAMKIVTFIEDKDGAYNAASILADEPERVKEA